MVECPYCGQDIKVLTDGMFQDPPSPSGLSDGRWSIVCWKCGKTFVIDEEGHSWEAWEGYPACGQGTVMWPKR